ncbi:ABC transporter ATP-binding protein [bacterium]|nr:ABC transporter ATP-binding protein [bacterium]
MELLLSIEDLRVYFYRPEGVLKAVDGLSYRLYKGEVLGIVGESGSGKSVSVLSILRLLPANGRIVSGSIIFDGKDILNLSREELRDLRGKDIGIVFQDPMSSLNPVITIGQQVMEPLLWHNLCSRSEAYERAKEMLGLVGIPLPEERMKEYPFQFSGGMRQRVMIALALICRPKLLIADEPTTSLDVTIQAQIIRLLKRMKEEFGMSVILITHNLALTTNFCDRLIIMYAGNMMETGRTKDILYNPSHPYTKSLLDAVPDIEVDKELIPIPGTIPNLIDPPSGCRFHPRCPNTMDICKEEAPPLFDIDTDHYSACWLYRRA